MELVNVYDFDKTILPYDSTEAFFAFCLRRWPRVLGPALGAQGVNIRYGIAPDKLYLGHLVYGASEATLTTLIAGQGYYVAVDSFNENGITPGAVFVL